MTRRYWLDNLRWITVLLVLVYHVFYIFNAEGVFGGLSPFAEVQYQDAVMYLLYPWFMLLLFVVAGISSRYALQTRSSREFIRSRTRKLLVPSTIGLLVFQWMTGYFNMLAAGALDSVPAAARYPAMVISGIGPLWFVQDLWLFSLLLVLICAIDRKGRLYDFFGTLCAGRAGLPITMLLFTAFWGLSQMFVDVSVHPLGGLFNLYRPHFYFFGFLTGYYLFSQEKMQEKLEKASAPLMLVAAAGALAYTAVFFGQDYTAPRHLALPWTNAFAWAAVLAALGVSRHRLDFRTPFTSYMSRSSYSIYIVHYLVLVATAWTLVHSTQLPPAAIYSICLAAVLAGSPLLGELLRRIPVVRWCVLGIK